MCSHMFILFENRILKSLSYILLMKGNLLAICLGRVLIILSIIIAKCSQIDNLLILFPAVPEFGVVLNLKFSSVTG